jgi:peptidoglycan/xylan/chitin deacetylase (PgdA/CDA1 family)/GT2 family glycosyltransferase
MPERTGTTSPDPMFSVVVSAYRSEATILQVVSSLQAQNPERFEVIVATSVGDRIGELVRHNFPDVQVLEWPTRLLPGGTRNLGASQARGRIIAFLEGDMVPRPGWVTNRIRAHQAGHEVVAGAVGVNPTDSRTSRATTYLTFGNLLQGLPAAPAKFSRSYLLSFTREVLDRAGPFDESVRTEEDTMMARRLEELGVKVWFEPTICIDHVGPSRFVDMLRDQRRRGRRQARAELLKWSPSVGRLKWENRSRSAVLSVVLRTLRHSLLRGRWLGRDLREAAPDRRDVLLALPRIIPGLLANNLGWGQEQLEFVRTDAFHRPAEALFVHTPFRSRVATNGEKVVALTFDDGPSEYTKDVLEVLEGSGIPATFFVLGKQVEAMPEVVRSIVSAGHSVGIHGWSHNPFVDLDASHLNEELEKTGELLNNLTGEECRHVRPPYGGYNTRVILELARRDLICWLWTTDAKDYLLSADAFQIARDTLKAITPGGVILLHDGGGARASTVRALPEIIEGVLARGFRFVSLHYAVDDAQIDASRLILSPLDKSVPMFPGPDSGTRPVPHKARGRGHRDVRVARL